MMSLNHFLHGLNASLNLIILSITGSTFRKTLLNLLMPKRKQNGNKIEHMKLTCKRSTNTIESKNVTFEDNCDDIQPGSV